MVSSRTSVNLPSLTDLLSLLRRERAVTLRETELAEAEDAELMSDALDSRRRPDCTLCVSSESLLLPKSDLAT